MAAMEGLEVVMGTEWGPMMLLFLVRMAIATMVRRATGTGWMAITSVGRGAMANMGRIAIATKGRQYASKGRSATACMGRMATHMMPAYGLLLTRAKGSRVLFRTETTELVEVYFFILYLYITSHFENMGTGLMNNVKYSKTFQKKNWSLGKITTSVSA